MRNLMELPKDLPVPEDDGACDHLRNMPLPPIDLLSTSGKWVNLNVQTQKPTIIFFYPRTGEPEKPAPADWDIIPGARGCTPQSCGYRDLYKEFQDKGYSVFGASSQDSSYQRAFVQRNSIPFEILSDEKFLLTDTMNLPTFIYNKTRLIKRMAWVIKEGKIIKIFYPVFPPHKNAEEVLLWITKPN